jgi:hypothetical protein
MCGQRRPVATQPYGSSTERPSARSDSNAESDAVRWRHGQHGTQQRAGRTKHAGGRLQRHIDQWVPCYVHNRVQQQQYRQLRTIDFQFQALPSLVPLSISFLSPLSRPLYRTAGNLVD